jgi:malate dehydrogenase
VPARSATLALRWPKELGDVVLSMSPRASRSAPLVQSSPVHGFDAHLIGTNSYDAGANVCIVTAGVPRKPA